MHSFWEKVILNTTIKRFQKHRDTKNGYSQFVLIKAYRILMITLRRSLKDFLLITIGIFSAAFGFKGFLLTNHFIDGGATGISLLISQLSNIPLPLLIILVNLPFIIMAKNIVSKLFAIKTTIAILGLSVVLATVNFPNVTNDNLLVAVFGGFFLGAGIGFAIRGGAVIDGTEVLAIYLSKKTGFTIGDIIIIINIIIFGTAAHYLGIEIALYSMITYLSASKTLDFIVEGIEEYIGVTIVATKCDEIKNMITNNMGRGVTIYKGKKGFGRRGEMTDTDIIYTVVTRLELNKLNIEIEKIEPNAFVVMNSVKETKGGMIKRRPLSH